MPSTNHLTQLSQFSPIFPVADLGRALAHYALLGFTTAAYEDGNEYGFAERDGVSLHLSAEAGGAAGSGEAYLYVQDADALFREWSSSGASGTTRQPVDTPYLLREGAHRDPDGNVIRFGSSLPDHEVTLRQHLESEYDIAISQLVALDVGVYRVDRRDGPSWVARTFPSTRSAQAAVDDAEILRFLAAQEFPAERVAALQPVSQIDGQSVLVTRYVAPVPRSERRAAVKAAGGLRHVGELLGRLHTLPEGPAATVRPGGAWHHVADGGPGEEISAARRILDDVSDLVAPEEAIHMATLRTEVAALDAGDGLPQALIHPDFVLSNMIASPDRKLTVVDWANAGRGPRLWSLAFVLFAEGAKNPARVDLVLAGYRDHVQLEFEELRRIATVARTRPVLLALWKFGQGRRSLSETAGEVVEISQVAQQVGDRANTAWAAMA